MLKHAYIQIRRSVKEVLKSTSLSVIRTKKSWGRTATAFVVRFQKNVSGTNVADNESCRTKN